MKQILKISLLVAMMLLLCGCGQMDEDTEPSPDIQEGSIIQEEGSELLSENGEDYGQIDYVISSEIGENLSEDAVAVVNEVLSGKSEDFMAAARSECALYHEADPDWQGSYSLIFHLFYADADIVSVLAESLSEQAGAAHLAEERFGYTFDAETGRRLTLTEMTGLDEAGVAAQIYSLIETAGETDMYFPDLEENLLTYLSEEQWTVYGDTVYVYYSAYTIASGAMGALEFPLPRAE